MNPVRIQCIVAVAVCGLVFSASANEHDEAEHTADDGRLEIHTFADYLGRNTPRAVDKDVALALMIGNCGIYKAQRITGAHILDDDRYALCKVGGSYYLLVGSEMWNRTNWQEHKYKPIELQAVGAKLCTQALELDEGTKKTHVLTFEVVEIDKIEARYCHKQGAVSCSNSCSHGGVAHSHPDL